jgi:protein phosphatase
MAALLADTKLVDRKQARKTSMGHALWNALGGRSEDLSIDAYKITLKPDDIVLLCTDGLYDMVPDEKLQTILESMPTAEAGCRKLVDLANENGGNDNITLIVSRFLTPQEDKPRAVVEVEVPLSELTAAPSETAQSTVGFNSKDFAGLATP